MAEGVGPHFTVPVYDEGYVNTVQATFMVIFRY